MSSDQRQHAEATPGQRGRSLQPRQDAAYDEITNPDVLRSLCEAEEAAAAERLVRLEADSDLNRRLQLQNYDVGTDDWAVFQAVLAEYGYGVFSGWGRAGLLRRMAQKHGRRGVLGYTKIPEGLHLSDDEALELAADLLIVSIEAFRTKTLMHPDPNRRWRPDGGASLRTYFIGRCLMELPDVYQAWVRKTHPNRERLAADPRRLDIAGSTGPEEAGLAAAEVARLRRTTDPATLLMFELKAAGFTYIEIAEQLTDSGITATEASVRTRLSRLRRRVKGG